MVTLPLLRSSLVSGAIFAFIISFSDINLALFLTGPQSTSLPVHIFSEIQWQGDPTIAAASSMQIVIIGLLILVVQRIFRLRLVVWAPRTSSLLPQAWRKADSNSQSR